MNEQKLSEQINVLFEQNPNQEILLTEKPESCAKCGNQIRKTRKENESLWGSSTQELRFDANIPEPTEAMYAFNAKYGQSQNTELKRFHKSELGKLSNKIKGATRIEMRHDVLGHGSGLSVFESAGVNVPRFATELNEVITFGMGHASEESSNFTSYFGGKYLRTIIASYNLADVLIKKSYYEYETSLNFVQRYKPTIDQGKLPKTEFDFYLTQEFSDMLHSDPEVQFAVKCLNKAIESEREKNPEAFDFSK